MTSHLKKLDYYLIIAVLLLTLFSLAMIFGISLSRESFLLFNKQLSFVAAGLLIMILISFFDYRFLRHYSAPIIIFYIITLLPLLLLLFFGSTIRGSAAWFRFGTFTIEPVEFAKITLIILLAKYFSSRHTEISRFIHIIASGVYTMIPVFLVMLQPDLGSALVFIALWIAIMLIAGIKVKHMIILILIGVLIASAGWLYLLQDYQKARILTFVNPQLDPLGSGYNIIQSLAAVGSGGLFGKGLGFGTQTQFGFLPEAHTDFIFAALAEELGLFGILIIFILYTVIFWRLISISLSTKNNFAKLFSAGLAVVIFVQFTINIGMNIGLLPITGLSLPFLSYGGSNMMAMFISLGLVQSIKAYV